MEYTFTLKDNNQRAFRLFTWFLFFLHIVAAMVVLYASEASETRIRVGVLAGFYFVLGVFFQFFKDRRGALETFSLIMALLYANFWYQQSGIIALLSFAVLYVLVYAVKGRSTSIGFSGEGASLTRVFKTVCFPWNQLDNVVLKDNILTVDFKTNKIIQLEILENGRITDETEFNLFCKNQLAV